MTMTSTISNTALNHMVSGYSNAAIAGMGIAKKIDLLAYAIAQGMTQGTLPLIGYNYSAGNTKRVKAAIKTAFAYSLLVAACGTLLLNKTMGISGIAWATPFADWIAFGISMALVIPCLMKLNEEKMETKR